MENNDSSSEQQPKEEPFLYGYHLVVFLDLLGQKEKLASIEGILKNPSPENRLKLQNTLRETVGTIWEFRKTFLTFYESFLKQEPTIAIPSTYIEEFNRLRGRSKINFQSFSDSIIIWTSIDLKSENDCINTLNSIHTILSSVGLMLPLYLGRGVPFRGGIEMEGAVLVTPGKNEIYGPALNAAYTLESIKAEYPRVLVGQGLIDFLDAIPNFTFQSQISKIFCISISKACKSWLIKDTDGHQMIHFLGQEAFAVVRGSEEIDQLHNQFLIEMDGFVQECLIKYQNNGKLSDRYTRLNNYIQTHLPTWKK